MDNKKYKKMISTILVSLSITLALTLALLILFLPGEVQYVESTLMSAPPEKVYDAIRFQEQLMEWSVWPEETNSNCTTKNVDGRLGAQTIYLNKKGKQFGYQELIELRENEKVKFFLKSFVAPFEDEVYLTFYLRQISPNETEVLIYFDEKMKKPQFLIAYFGGIIKWVHSMHLKDLASLKAYVEG